MSGKLQLGNVVTFFLELRMRHGYNCWKVTSKRNESKESNYELVHCAFHKFMRITIYILIDEMFYVMHVLTIIIT
jgi:hypothetical protein